MPWFGRYPGNGPFRELPPWERPGWKYGWGREGWCWYQYARLNLDPTERKRLLEEEREVLEKEKKALEERLKQIEEELKKL
jgi:hypothetical protein